MADTTGALRTEVPLRAPGSFFIDGDWRVPDGTDTFDVIDSATEDLYYRVAAASGADVDRAVGAARSALDTGPWPRLSHAERAGFLREIADGVERRTGDILQIWPRESGVVQGVGQALLADVPAAYRRFADLAGTFPFVEPVTPAAGEYGMVVREPVGVVGAIIPWNAPMTLIVYKLAPALLAGCTVVLKCSPEAPGAGYLIAEIAAEAGLPPGVLNVITADRAESEQLVRDPRGGQDRLHRVDGDRQAHRRHPRRAHRPFHARARRQVRGGDPRRLRHRARRADPGWCRVPHLGPGVLLVDPDRGPSEPARCHGRGARRVLSQVKVGDPLDPTVQMGPLATERQRAGVEDLIAQGVDSGATLATGGKRPASLDRGWFLEPTVFGHVDNGSPIAQQEIFGPVLSVIPDDDEDHAVRIANDSIYGLNASVFTPDTERAASVARRLQAGTVGHNAFRTDFVLGFGGFNSPASDARAGATVCCRTWRASRSSSTAHPHRHTADRGPRTVRHSVSRGQDTRRWSVAGTVQVHDEAAVATGAEQVTS